MEWLARDFKAGIHGAQKIYPNDIGDPLIFY